jgi:hypothetical protein
MTLYLGYVERGKRANHTNNGPHGRGRAATSASICAFSRHIAVSKFVASIDEGNKCRNKVQMLAHVASGLVPDGHSTHAYVRQRRSYVWYLRISWHFWFFVSIHRADHTMNSPPGTRPRRYVGERSRFEQAMCLSCFTYYRVVPNLKVLSPWARCSRNS